MYDEFKCPFLLNTEKIGLVILVNIRGALDKPLGRQVY